MEPEKKYDAIIVGGGSAGCIIAGRLADAGHEVLVLEAGDAAEVHPETLRADGYKDAFANDDLLWERYSVPQPGLDGRRVYLGSGRVVGGSAAINAMVYTRGAAADYARWELPGWEWDDLVPDFEAIEDRLGLGRLAPTRFGEATIEAAERAGFDRADDLNQGDLHGVLGYEWMNADFDVNARRNSYVAFVKDAEARAQEDATASARSTSKRLTSDRTPSLGGTRALDVAPGARVGRVLFSPDGAESVGVEYSLADGTVHRAHVRPKGEVILCAGALATPCVLMRSGVGPASVLQRFGIQVVAPHKAIGANLQDHPNVTVFFHGGEEVDAPVPQVYGFHRANPHTPLPDGMSDTCYVMYPAHSSFREGMIRMLPAMALPDSLRREPVVRALRGAVDLAFRANAVRNFVRKMWGIVVVLGKPLSRGTVRLGGPHPGDEAVIDPAYFADPRDLQTVVRGIRLARRIASASPLASWHGRELMPGGRATSDDALAAFVRKNAMTTYHYAGTCRMGTADHDPVDLAFRVRGVAGLRVADASVIPEVPVSAMNATSMLIGWRAADAIEAALDDR